MRQALKVNQWYSGMKAHIGVDAGAGYQGAERRAKVEHPFLIIKRDFGFTKTRSRGMAKNLNHSNMLFTSANWVMRARAVAVMG